VVDYVRVYDEDHGKKTAPTVTLKMDGNMKECLLGQPVTFHVRADDQDGTVKMVYLFSSGYIRAEVEVSPPSTRSGSWIARFVAMFAKRGHSVHQTFTVTNLFEVSNTVIAMAKDNDGMIGLSAPLQINTLTGNEYTGTAYQGKPHSIPGKIIAGHYDEGGKGVAFQDNSHKGDPNASWRIAEIANSVETSIPATAGWVTYRVLVKEAGEYDVELFMNRPGHIQEGNDFTDHPDEVIQLDVDKVKAAEWRVPAAWVSGSGWRTPLKPVGKQSIILTAGEHQLIVRFDRIKTANAFFGGFEFAPKNNF